jgi:hypothetical protein
MIYWVCLIVRKLEISTVRWSRLQKRNCKYTMLVVSKRYTLKVLVFLLNLIFQLSLKDGNFQTSVYMTFLFVLN